MRGEEWMGGWVKCSNALAKPCPEGFYIVSAVEGIGETQDSVSVCRA